MYTSSEHGNEFWPSLVEKAYAKLHGGYNVIEKIPVTDILSDFTGTKYLASNQPETVVVSSKVLLLLYYLLLSVTAAINT